MWFQFLIFLICLPKNDCAAVIHDGWWTLKFLIVGALFIGSLYIDNDPFMIGYMQFSRVVSVIFLAYQAILMLVVAYVMNDTLVKGVNASNGDFSSCAGITLITIFFILTGGNITWIVFQYIEFGSCAGSNWIMTFTLIAGVVMYGLVLLRTRDDASLLTSAIVLTYCLYLQWSALSSDNDSTCNPYTESAANTLTLLVFGCFFTFTSLLVISAST